VGARELTKEYFTPLATKQCVISLLFLVLVIKFPGSTREADTAHKVLKARI